MRSAECRSICHCGTEIYRLVKDARQNIIRPTLLDTDDEDLLTMVRRCWAEDPCDRPDFSTVKGMIKRINRYVHNTFAKLTC